MTVAGVRGAQVRLGINAPADVRVSRLEIMSEPEQKNVRASAN